MTRTLLETKIDSIANAVVPKIYIAKLAEDYDGIGQYALVALSPSSTSLAYRAKVSAGDAGNRRPIPAGSPVTVRSYRGSLEVMSFGQGQFEGPKIIGDVPGEQIGPGIPGENLAPGSITNVTPFASTIRPVKIVSALPSLPNPDYPEGQLIVLTTDGKLYRNFGGVWTKAVDGIDLISDTVGDAALSPTSSLAKVVQARSQEAISGGGRIEWGVTANVFKWTVRFITIPNALSSTGYIDFGPLPGGVTIAAWNALYYRHQIGQDSSHGNHALDGTGTGYFVIDYPSYVPPDPTGGFVDYLIGIHNGDNGYFYLFDGRVLPSGQVIQGGHFIPDLSITNAHVANLSGGKITAGTILAAQIGAGEIIAGKIAAGAIVAADIAADTITGAKIAAGAIAASEIAAEAVTAAALAAMTITARTITIENGHLVLKNAGGTVIIDGSSNMFKIMATGTLTVAFSTGIPSNAGTNVHLTGLGSGFTPPPPMLPFTTHDTASGDNNRRGHYILSFNTTTGALIYVVDCSIRLLSGSPNVILQTYSITNNNGGATAGLRFYLLMEAGI